MRQITFACQPSFEKFARKSRREEFLTAMEVIVPLSELEALIAPYYPKAGKGRQPAGLGIMLRIYFLQHWFNLSDPGAEDALYESPVLRSFAGVDLGRAAAPDETTILNFRHLLEGSESSSAGAARTAPAPSGTRSPSWPRSQSCGVASAVPTASIGSSSSNTPERGVLAVAKEGARDASRMGTLPSCRVSRAPMRHRWKIRNQTPLPRGHAFECCPVQPGAANDRSYLVGFLEHGIRRGACACSSPGPAARLIWPE